MGDESDDRTVTGQIEQSEEAMKDAVGARGAGLSDRVVVNRCYYACFHAARAVLSDRGFAPRSHGGVISTFGSEVVKSGEVSRETGRFLNEISELRTRADYTQEPIEQDIDQLLDQSKEFVAEATELCSTNEE